MPKYCIIAILIILALIDLISSVVFSFLYSEYTFDKDKIISEIQYSLNGKLIIDFSIKPNCSKEEETLTFGEWEGTVDGCNCGGQISKGECGDNKKECNTISSLEPKTYQKINGSYICIKRSTHTYLDYLNNNQIIGKNNQCPNGYISCGTIDTNNRILCLKNERECPVNATYIKKIFFNYNKSLSINDINDERIISLFQLSESQPCINPNEKTWKYYYELEPDNIECKTKINEEIEDNNYENFISISKYQLYQENNIFMEKKYEEELKKDKIHLFGKAFLGLNSNDLQNYSYDKLLSKQKLSNNCNYVMRIFSIIFFVAIILPFSALCSGVQGDLNSNGLGYAIGIFCFISATAIIITFLVDFILSIIIYICSNNIISILNINENESYINELFKILYNEHIKKNYLFSLLIWIGYVVLFFICIIVAICLLKKYNKEKKEKSLMEKEYN